MKNGITVKFAIIDEFKAGKKYFKCQKCGNKLISLTKYFDISCTEPAPYRTSKICGGLYLEITEEEFNKI